MGRELAPQYWEGIDFRLMLSPEVVSLYPDYQGDLWADILDASAMAVAFGYRDELFNLVAMCYTYSDTGVIQILYDTYPLEITINRGCLMIAPETKGE